MDGLLETNGALRRVCSFAVALPATTTTMSLAAAMQTLKEGGPGLRWVAGTASNALVFANRNVVIPLLKIASSGVASVSDPAAQRAASPLTDPGQLQFTQSRRRRSGKVIVAAPPKRINKSSKAAAKLPVTAFAATVEPIKLGQLSLAVNLQRQQQSLNGQVSQPHESLQIMQLGLQSSML